MDIIEIYKECQDFEKAVALSGMPTLQAHITLLRSGVISLQDKIQYSSEAGKLGAKAEFMFQKLVPNAVNYNRVVNKNNKHFDFKYGDLTIDVKYSSRINKKINGEEKDGYYWSARSTGKVDLFVLFLERNKGDKLDNPHILIIPKSFATAKHFNISPKWIKNFEVEKDDIEGFLKQYMELKNVSTVGV